MREDSITEATEGACVGAPRMPQKNRETPRTQDVRMPALRNNPLRDADSVLRYPHRILAVTNTKNTLGLTEAETTRLLDILQERVDDNAEYDPTEDEREEHKAEARADYALYLSVAKASGRPLCPKCDGILGEHYALSRRDNKTHICSDCGTREAMEDWAAAMSRDKAVPTK